MRSLAFGRVFGALVAVVGLGVSVWMARKAVAHNAEFHQWLQARPMESPIDLSQPGELTLPFHQTCGSSHGEALYLECPLDGAARKNPAEFFKELAGKLVVKDANGKEIETAPIDDKTVSYWDGRLTIAHLLPFRRGEYVATLHIETGVPALAGQPQLVYVQYQLCGLEQMPALIFGAFSCGSGVIGLVAAVCVLPGLIRSGLAKESGVAGPVASSPVPSPQSSDSPGT